MLDNTLFTNRKLFNKPKAFLKSSQSRSFNDLSFMEKTFQRQSSILEDQIAHSLINELTWNSYASNNQEFRFSPIFQNPYNYTIQKKSALEENNKFTRDCTMEFAPKVLPRQINEEPYSDESDSEEDSSFSSICSEELSEGDMVEDGIIKRGDLDGKKNIVKSLIGSIFTVKVNDKSLCSVDTMKNLFIKNEKQTSFVHLGQTKKQLNQLTCNAINHKILQESPTKSSNSLKETIEHQVNCNICNNRLDDNQINSCFRMCDHAYHEECLYELIKKKTVFCPVCMQKNKEFIANV